MIKRVIYIFLIFALLTTQTALAFTDTAQYSWAEPSIYYLSSKGILNGVGDGLFMPSKAITRAEFSVIIARLLGASGTYDVPYSDVKKGDYYYDAVSQLTNLGLVNGLSEGEFSPNVPISRQDLFTITARAIEKHGATTITVAPASYFALKYNDADKIASYAVPAIASISSIISGDDYGNINPTKTANRAETAVLAYRVAQVLNGQATVTPTPAVKPALPVYTSGTEIIGQSVATLQQMKLWAQNNGATAAFYNAADLYWAWGEKFGIRADILYAQAAKETKYGNYGGAVTADMNNFAGIKTLNATGDTKEDHETFATADDGVRAHFNHMAVYVGLLPIGTPHARISVLKTMEWAGKVRFVEELGGRWAPNYEYGLSVLNDFLAKILATKIYPAINVAKKIVYLSPSNQFTNPYIVGNTNEGEQMIAVAAMVAANLKNMGYSVITANQKATFAERSDEAASAGAFCYVAIHSNAANNEATGTEAFFRENDSQSLKLATAVYNAVAAISPTENDRGLKSGTAAGLAETRLPFTPPTLVEVEFHDVASTAEWIVNSHEAIAKAIATGIDNYWKTL